MYGGSGIWPSWSQNLLENTLVGELDQTVSFLYHINNGSLEQTVAEN